MTLSNEIKVGLLGIGTAVLVLIGLSYLRGSSVFTTTFQVHAQYANVSGLGVGDKVVLNGYKVGQVKTMKIDGSTGKVEVYIEIENGVQLPTDSYAIITSLDLLGTMGVQVHIGKEKKYIANGGAIRDSVDRGLMASLKQEVVPVKVKLERLMDELTEAMHSINVALGNGQQLGRIMGGVEQSVNNVAQGTRSLYRLDSILRSTHSIMANLERQNSKVASTVGNAGLITDSLAASMHDTRVLMAQARESMTHLSDILERIKKGQGTMGKLAANDSLYTNLNKTSENLAALLADLKANPKRYVHFSLFGKKPKPAAEVKK